jgi:hypothetical protein
LSIYRNHQSLLATTMIWCLVGCGGNSSNVADQVTLPNQLTIQDSSQQEVLLTTANAPKLSLGCSETASDYKIVTGSFLIDPSQCNTILLTTNAALGNYSEGVIEFNQDITLPAFASAVMERSSGDTNRPLELKVLGGYIGVTPQNGELWYYIYESESHWTGWINSGIPSGNEVLISARQDARRITAWLNGVRLPDFNLISVSSDKRIWLKLKGDPAARSSALVRNFTVVNESESLEGLFSPLATSAVPQVIASGSLSLTPQTTFAHEPLVHKIAVRNDSAAEIAIPEVIASPNGMSRIRNAIHSRSCDKATKLLPNQECLLFLVDGTLTNFSSLQRMNLDSISTTTRQVLLKTDSSYQSFNASLPLKTVAVPKGFITGISPIVVKQGIRPFRPIVLQHY